jgi:ATP-dependent DNA helicase RecG
MSAACQAIKGVTDGANGEATPQVPRKSSTCSKRQRIGNVSREELQTAAGIRDREHFRRNYLEPLLSADLLERTIPDKPRSSRQKYHGSRTRFPRRVRMT